VEQKCFQLSFELFVAFETVDSFDESDVGLLVWSLKRIRIAIA